MNARAVLATAAAQGLEARLTGFHSILEPAGVLVDGLTISNDVGESTGLLADYFLAHPASRAIATLGPLPA